LENVDVKQFRKVFRFPGIPIYSLASDRFLKLLVENNIPPLRFSGLGIGNHYLNHVDISMYSQTLWTNTTNGELWTGIGAQMDIVFKHWFNLESTFSAGVAKAWHGNESFFEWFLSFKLLKN
jgi:hypothetical protein